MVGQEESCCFGRSGLARGRRSPDFPFEPATWDRRPSVDSGSSFAVSFPASSSHLAEPPLPLQHLAMGWGSSRTDDVGGGIENARLKT